MKDNRLDNSNLKSVDELDVLMAVQVKWARNQNDVAITS
jgi:hypothetical protein